MRFPGPSMPAIALLVLVCILFVNSARAGSGWSSSNSSSTMFGATWVIAQEGETHAMACARVNMVRTDVIFKVQSPGVTHSQGLWTPSKFQSVARALGAHCKYTFNHKRGSPRSYIARQTADPSAPYTSEDAPTHVASCCANTMWCYDRREAKPFALPTVLSQNVTLICISHGYGRAYNNYGTLPTSMDNVDAGLGPVYTCKSSTQSGPSLQNFSLATHPTTVSMSERSGGNVSVRETNGGTNRETKEREEEGKRNGFNLLHSPDNDAKTDIDVTILGRGFGQKSDEVGVQFGNATCEDVEVCTSFCAQCSSKSDCAENEDCVGFAVRGMSFCLPQCGGAADGGDVCPCGGR